MKEAIIISWETFYTPLYKSKVYYILEEKE